MALLRNMTCNFRHPMSLRHTVGDKRGAGGAGGKAGKRKRGVGGWEAGEKGKKVRTLEVLCR